MEKKVTSHVTKGIVIALVLIILDLVALFTDFKLESWYGWGAGGLMLVAFIWAGINWANQMNNQVTFGNIFVHTFKTSAVVACLWFVYTLLVVYVISPEFIDKAIQKGMEDAEKSGRFSELSEEDMERGMELGRKFAKIGMLAGSVILTLIMGVIGGLLGGAIAKKNPPPTPFQ